MVSIKTWFITDPWEKTVIIVISLGFRIFNMVVTGEGRWFSGLLLLCSNSVSASDSPFPPSRLSMSIKCKKTKGSPANSS